MNFNLNVDNCSYVTETWHDDVFKSGCCNHEHPINTEMIQCTEIWEENGIDKYCDIFYCYAYIQNRLKLDSNSMENLWESEGMFKCHKHGFETIHVADLIYQPPVVEDIENETKVMTFATSKKNRQTGQEEEFDVSFRLTAQNGILYLELNEKGEKWEAAKKSSLHKYKKDVLQKVLKYMLGYDAIEQNKKIKKDRIEMILCSLIGLDEDTRLIVERTLGKEAIDEVVDLLQQERMVLILDVSAIIESDDLCNITGYLMDVYNELFRKHSQILNEFLLTMWQRIIEEWIKHPTDETFITAIEEYRNTYHNIEQYKALHEIYKTFEHKEWFSEYVEHEFNLFAYDLSDQVIKVFMNEVKACLLDVATKLSRNIINAKEMTKEQRWYVGQSIGGATANSMKRKTYGGNLSDEKKKKMHDMIDSMLLSCKDGTDANISFRIVIEDNGGLRILKDEGTAFVCSLLDKIQPELRQNLILKYNGNFMKILAAFLGDKTIRASFESLLAEYDSDECADDDIKIMEQENFAVDKQLRGKLYKEFVTGIFNKALWGYLKQIKPKQNNLSLRDSLKVHLKTTTPFSSLQVTT